MVFLKIFQCLQTIVRLTINLLKCTGTHRRQQTTEFFNEMLLRLFNKLWDLWLEAAHLWSLLRKDVESSMGNGKQSFFAHTQPGLRFNAVNFG